jgi:hypothetical protein
LDITLNKCLYSATRRITYLELWFGFTHLKRRTVAVPKPFYFLASYGDTEELKVR